MGWDCNVRGLQIAMGDPLFMRRFERFNYLSSDGIRFIDRERPRRNAMSERFATSRPSFVSRAR
jgi:hypothetical protein